MKSFLMKFDFQSHCWRQYSIWISSRSYLIRNSFQGQKSVCQDQIMKLIFDPVPEITVDDRIMFKNSQGHTSLRAKFKGKTHLFRSNFTIYFAFFDRLLLFLIFAHNIVKTMQHSIATQKLSHKLFLSDSNNEKSINEYWYHRKNTSLPTRLVIG